jgi:hypothetical protein
MDAVNGRGPHGHFAKGHKFSRNNRKALRLRWAVLRHVTAADVLEIMRTQLAKAKEGDTKAAAFVYDRCLGKPVAPVELSGPDGEPLAGVSLADVTAAVLEALADDPAGRVKVAQRLKALCDRRANGEGKGDTP